MTIRVSYMGGVDQALEIITAFAGAERGERTRLRNGEGASLHLDDGSTTFILREVPAAAPVESQQGEQRHGSLELSPTDSQLAGELVTARARIVELESLVADLNVSVESLRALVDAGGD